MEQVFPFLQELKRNNNRDWFLSHKKEYQKVKKEVQDFLAPLLVDMLKVDPGLEGLAPKDCMFRINRDIRFSADKSPYKTNIGLVLSPGGKKSGLGCYYLHLDPDSSFIGGGVYMPEKEALAAIRQEIDYNLDEFQALISTPSFKKHFGTLNAEHSLKRAPKGYEEDNPAIEYLRLKSFTATKSVNWKKLNADKLHQECLDTFAALRPFNAFLNRALSDLA